jgi:hypothetical protein
MHFPCWHEFKNSIIVSIRFLHSQLFHFLITVYLGTPCSYILTHQFSTISSSTCVTLPPARDVWGVNAVNMRYSINHFIIPCTILWYAALSCHHHPPSLIGSKFQCRENASPIKNKLYYKRFGRTTFPVLWLLPFNLSPAYHLLQLAPSAAC